MVATLAQQSSISDLMSRQLAARSNSSNSSWLGRLMNCSSQGSTRSFSEFLESGFSISGGSLFLQCSLNSMIFLRGADLTLGRQISSSTPVSSIMFFSSCDFLATAYSISNLPWSEAIRMTLLINMRLSKNMIQINISYAQRQGDASPEMRAKGYQVELAFLGKFWGEGPCSQAISTNQQINYSPYLQLAKIIKKMADDSTGRNLDQKSGISWVYSIISLSFSGLLFEKYSLIICKALDMMEVSPLANIDRLSSRGVFRRPTGSPFGIIGTCMFLAVTIWMNVWIAISYAQGNYFQSSFQTQATATETLQVPYDIKMAVVFHNKTSGAVANHTLLTTFFDTRLFASNYMGSNINVEAATICNSSNINYFSDAVNPVTLTDCFLFTPSRAFLYTYAPVTSNAMSQVGFLFALTCYNAFFCRSGGSTQTLVQNNMIAAFTNYSITFILSTRVLQPDGSTKHQVYNVSSGQFTNPSTPTASFDAEVMICNTTMDYSVMPWRNMKYSSNLGFFGLQRAVPRTSGLSIYTPFPKVDAMASNYQYQIFRYYKKEDWLLGVIGGSAFLIYLALWLICHPINQALFRINAAEELLLQAEEADQPLPEALKKPKVSWCYLITRFLPWHKNRKMQTLAQVMDISSIIKKLKIAKRNVIHFVGAKNLYSRYRHLEFGIELPTRHGVLNHQSQMISQMEQRPQGEENQGSQPEEQRRQQKASKKERSVVDQSSEKLVVMQHQQSNAEEFMENPQLQGADSLPMLKNKKSSELELLRNSAGRKMQAEQEKPAPNIEESQQKEPEDEFDMNFQRVQMPVPPQKVKNNEKQIQIPQEKINELIKMQEEQRKSRAQSRKSIKNIEVESTKKVQREKSVQNEGSNIEDFQNILARQPQKGSQSHAILMQDQQLLPVASNRLTLEDKSATLGMHPDVVTGIRYSNNTEQLLGNYQTAMYLTNNPGRYNQIHQIYQYSPNDGGQRLFPKTKCKVFLENSLYYFKQFDFYSVKIQFNAHSANHSWLGVLFTMMIIAFPVLQLANMLQLTGTYQVHISKDFLQPKDIKYTVTTGDGFRPAVCGSYNFAYYLSDYGQTVQLQYFTYTPSSGYTFYNSINLPSNSHGMLGITPDSMHSNIQTGNCFAMPDGIRIPMGGYNTEQEAFFGFRITGYCSGTNSYCSSVQSSTNANLITFMNTASYTPTLYMPINQYSATANSVTTGQTYAHVLREGTGGFNMNSAIEQTLYLDRIQLIDNYKARFVGNNTILEETISTSRYQLGEVTKAVNASNPYYEMRLRPSGMVTRVYLSGSTLYVILGMIGGIFFLAYAIFHCCGKIYNAFNVRARLAKVLYEQQAQNCSTMHKLLFLFARPLLSLFSCTPDNKYINKRLQMIDQKIKQDLNAIEMVKLVTSLAKLSTIPYKRREQKQIASLYLKERADVILKEDPPQEEGPPDDLQYQQENEFDLHSGNQIVNEDNPLREESQLDSNHKLDSWIDIEMRLQQDKDADHIPAVEPYCNQQNINKSKASQYLSRLDIFSSDAEFALNGQWRVRSIFSTILSLLTIVIVLCIFVLYIVDFSQGNDKRISYNKGMLVDPANSRPLVLNTAQNFRAAFGFYTKPNFAFVNVSSFNLNGPNSTLGATFFQYQQRWINNAISITETRYDLIPCPANYFDGYMSPNDDPSYYSSITNGYCLPENITLFLTPEVQNNSQYFRLSIYNKTAAASSSMTGLTGTFALGIYLTIPIINLEANGFSSKVHQLRPNSEAITRTYSINVTLTQQAITFTTPRYKTEDPKTTIATYNYLENRPYEIANNNAATNSPRNYNVSFTYSGLVETYTVSYSSIAELFGYAGGVILVVLFTLGCIAQSFNSFYRDFLIGRELYLVWPTEEKEKQGKQVKEEKETLLDHKERGNIERINNINEFAVFRAWLLFFPANMIKSYDWNENLHRVQMIRGRALFDLDLYHFYQDLAKVRDTINSSEKYKDRLSDKEDIPLTSIFDKQVIAGDSYQFDYSKSRPFYFNVVAHQLSSRDQWIISQNESEVQLENVFDRKYLDNVLVYKVESYDYAEEPLPLQSSQPEVMVREASSSKSRRKSQVQPLPQRQEAEIPPESNHAAQATKIQNEVEQDSGHPLEGSAFQYNIQDNSEQQQSDA